MFDVGEAGPGLDLDGCARLGAEQREEADRRGLPDVVFRRLGQAMDQQEVVAGEEHLHASACQGLHEQDHLRHEPGIEAGFRLVQKDDGVAGEGPVGDQVREAGDLAQALGEQVGLGLTVPLLNKEPVALEQDLAAEDLRERGEQFGGGGRSHTSQRRGSEGLADIIVSLVEVELAALVGGDEAVVHRQHLAWRDEQARLRGDLARDAGGATRADAVPLQKELAVLVVLHSQGPYPGGTAAPEPGEIGRIGAKDGGEFRGDHLRLISGAPSQRRIHRL